MYSENIVEFERSDIHVQQSNFGDVTNTNSSANAGHEIEKDENGIFNEYVCDFAAGLCGGCAGLAFGHPFDTLKVRQQTQSGVNSSLIKCFKETAHTEGLRLYTYNVREMSTLVYNNVQVRGFFRGMAFPLAAVGLLNSIFFGVYGNTIKYLSHVRHGDRNATPSYGDIFIAGGLAGAVQAIPASPIELVKVKLQAQEHGGHAPYRGPIHCIRKIYSIHGARGCFRGLNATVCREVPGFSTYITSYQYLCDTFTPDGAENTVTTMLLAGGIAGMLSWMTNIPVDIVKSRLQADSLSRPMYRGMYHCALASYKEDGVRVFWRGLPVICMRAFPVNAVTLAVYSSSLQTFQRLSNES